MNDRINEILTRCKNATEGEWKSEIPYSGRIAISGKDKMIDWICHMQVSNCPNWRADAEFIVHARKDIIYLLDLLAEKEAEIKRLVDANKSSGWHVAKSDPPPKSIWLEEYNVVIGDAKKSTALYYADGKWKDSEGKVYTNVILWQPMPDVPEEENQ
jgi:hypothetical protein